MSLDSSEDRLVLQGCQAQSLFTLTQLLRAVPPSVRLDGLGQRQLLPSHSPQEEEGMVQRACSPISQRAGHFSEEVPT